MEEINKTNYNKTKSTSRQRSENRREKVINILKSIEASPENMAILEHDRNAEGEIDDKLPLVRVESLEETVIYTYFQEALKRIQQSHNEIFYLAKLVGEEALLIEDFDIYQEIADTFDSRYFTVSCQAELAKAYLEYIEPRYGFLRRKYSVACKSKGFDVL